MSSSAFQTHKLSLGRARLLPSRIIPLLDKLAAQQELRPPSGYCAEQQMRVPEARRSDADGVLMLFLHGRSTEASLEDFTCFATGRVLGAGDA